MIIPWNKPLPRLSTKAEKDLFVENFRGNGAAMINRLVPAFLIQPKFESIDLEKVYQLTAYFKKYGVLCNDPRNLLHDEYYG